MTTAGNAPQLAFDAQAQVLGPLLCYPETVGEVLLQVQDEDFPDPPFRAIFRAVRQLYAAGRPVDGLTVADVLGSGYRDLLAEIVTVTVTGANVMEYVRILRHAARLRRLRELGEQLAASEDLDTAQTLVDEINTRTRDRSGVRVTTMQQAYDAFLDRQGEDRPPPYLTWGIPALDDKIHVEAGDLIVLGGYPSAGKTALALQFARHIARGKRVGYFYLENNDRKLFDRIVSATAMVPFTRIKTHTLDETDFRAVLSVREQLTQPQLELIEASGMTTMDVRSTALARHYDLIAIDYLQKLRGDRSGRGLSDFERVSRISSDLQELGQQTGITVIALSQLSRPDKRSDGPAAPTMASLRQSGQIEQDADVVMLLYMEDPGKTAQRTLKLAKNKEGLAGIAMRMTFDGDTQTFARVAPREEPPQRQRPRQTSFWEEIQDAGDLPFPEGR